MIRVGSCFIKVVGVSIHSFLVRGKVGRPSSHIPRVDGPGARVERAKTLASRGPRLTGRQEDLAGMPSPLQITTLHHSAVVRLSRVKMASPDDVHAPHACIGLPVPFTIRLQLYGFPLPVTASLTRQSQISSTRALEPSV